LKFRAAPRLLRANRLPSRGTIGGALVSALAIAGVLAFLHAVGVLSTDRHVVGRFVVVAGVVVLVIGPWLVRLARSLSLERAARIREHERAELAAHLHDSVLQTLALIQKRAGDPRAVAGLARRQERELRRWLFTRPHGTGSDSAKAALERAAVEVEELHGVPIEAVIVGERQLDMRLEALVGAAREAMTNAAKFAGSDHVDLYAELRESRSEVFVRDRGSGFDPASIPEDRGGVRDSIVGRVERHGGRACVRSKPGQGTEIELVMERARA
jgi:signal transduction histidine kinase